jgi:hypothetical protein
MATDWPESRAAALAAILPATTDVYIAMFLGNPIAGGVELTLTGYARVAYQDWTTADLGGSSVRSNASFITFPTITQAGSADYWGIYDSAVAGVLLRSGQLQDNLGQMITINFLGLGDEAQFTVGALTVTLTEA